MLSLESKVHECIVCKKIYPDIIKYSPVYSFGEPRGKPIIVVGLNPSIQEYPEYLKPSNDVEERRKSQLTYFDHSIYSYFKTLSRFFGYGEIKYQNQTLKAKIGWIKSPYEQISALDLVKCPTVSQWTKLKKNDLECTRIIQRNCESYLKEQLLEYKPKVIVSYGADVIDWFRKYSRDNIEDFEIFIGAIGNYSFKGIAIPQRQGPHSIPEIRWVQQKLLEIL